MSLSVKKQLVKEIETVLDILNEYGMLWDDGYGSEGITHPFESDAHGDAISEYAPLLNAILLGGDDESEYTEAQGNAAAKLYWTMFKKYIKDNKLSPDDSTSGPVSYSLICRKGDTIPIIKDFESIDSAKEYAENHKGAPLKWKQVGHGSHPDGIYLVAKLGDDTTYTIVS